MDVLKRATTSLGWLIILAITLLTVSPTAWAAETLPLKKVLILYSNGSDLPVHHLFTSGLQEQMRHSSGFKIDYMYEYLEIPRYSSNKEYRAFLSRLLKEKYVDNRPDLVVTHLEPAANFMIAYGEQTFPGVPAVLGLYEGEGESYPAPPANYRDVVGTFGTTTAVSLILQAQPNTKKIYVVAGDSERERKAVAAFAEVAASFTDRVEFIYLNTLPFEQILESAKTIGDDSVILYFYIFRDVAGNTFVPGDALQKLCEVASVPIYSSVSVYIGRGTVGGYMSSQEVLGSKVAVVGADILMGNMGAHDPIERSVAAEYIFDWRQLKRWGVDEGRLPPGRRMEFKQAGVWETYRWQFASGVLVIAGQSVLIGLLLVNRKRRRQAQAALGELNAELDKKVAERTLELQELNTSLEEEVMERQVAEQRVREQAKLLDIAHDYVIVCDLDGRVVYWNRGAEKGYGYTAAEAVGQVTYELLRTEFPASAEVMKAELLISGHWTGELTHTRKDGVRIVVQSYLTLNRDTAGNPLSFLGINHDITEQKQLDMELARLDRLNTVGEMAASIGHEVRNPLTTVRGYLQFYGRKNVFAAYRDQLDLMIEELDRANGIITEFLSLAKNKTVNMSSTDLNQVIQSLVSLLQPDALLRGINIELELGNIPEVMADDQEMRQCILNLVGNAMDATPKGGTVTIGTASDDNRVILTVRDHGPGIPPEIKDKLGTPFLTTKEKGVGLGLAVCYRIAQRHQAIIKVGTSPKGTAINFIFSQQP
ncbi:MAG: ATP-binding protein [Negativicutes bacterium]|nr:ATP-binding protein [Negativicutes bacterium]